MIREAEYYLVVDLEATCDDHGAVPRHESEIIEIGAVLVDGQSLRPVAELQTFVRPVVHPGLTAFCTELTTITQADVDPAPTFPAAATRLAAFGRGALFCSWGNYDRNQLAADAARHGVAPPLGPDHWNLKTSFADALGGRRGIGMSAALARLGMVPHGTHHRGIDDARNIARVLPFVLGRPPVEQGPVRPERGALAPSRRASTVRRSTPVRRTAAQGERRAQPWRTRVHHAVARARSSDAQ